MSEEYNHNNSLSNTPNRELKKIALLVGQFLKIRWGGLLSDKEDIEELPNKESIFLISLFVVHAWDEFCGQNQYLGKNGRFCLSTDFARKIHLTYVESLHLLYVLM